MAWVSEAGKVYVLSMKDNGDRFWYQDNKLHREKGPAIEFGSGGGVWFWRGEKVSCASQKEFEKVVELKKQANHQSYFDVKVECMVPAVMTYRVLAKDAEEAIGKIKNMQPRDIQYKPGQKQERKLSIYDAGTSLLRLVKNLGR
jgi:hypothetical protein